MVTLAALRTSQRIVAEKGPGPGGTWIRFGAISKTMILGGSPGGGVGDGGGGAGGVGDGVGVEDDEVTVTVTDCVTLPALLLAVSV